VLRETKWGIKEPVDGKEINAELIDLVIVPLLVFDKFGHRVGYGKGFYDRFLSKCRRDTIKIGLSLFPQVDEIDDVNRYDVKLDYGIVPGKTVAFN
jgi:5-formyltetrahydrofolate cyclo-ligase